MPYTYEMEGRVMHVRWSGVVSREDLQAIGRDMPRVAAEAGFAQDTLHTFDAVTGYSFQPIAAYMLSLLRKRMPIPTPVRSASVVRTPQTRALAKIFQSLNRSQNLEIELFDSEADARRWLAREDDAEPAGDSAGAVQE